MTEFNTLELSSVLLKNLADLGFTTMTLVQSKALPMILDGQDVLARAKTGSGKTATFGLGLLNRLAPGAYDTQGLVLCPTRELAEQVANEIRRLARSIPNTKVSAIYGGVPQRAQLNSLRRNPHIIVGTPGRVHKHLRDGAIDLGRLQTLVLDEADRMLDMGFAEELDAIMSYIPKVRQTLLFSATYPDSVADMSDRVQNLPNIVDVTDEDSPAMIAQSWCSVTRENRNAQLQEALRCFGGELNLVFCNTRADCESVSGFLNSKGIVAKALHGDLDQRQRNQALVRFSNRSISVMVATDVAARGLDVKNVDAIFNFELPSQPSTYVHRIGRTGRAGASGVAISLVDERDRSRLAEIMRENPDIELKQRDIPEQSRRRAIQGPTMTTIELRGGKKHKLRPGDVLGALTADNGIAGNCVGSIDLFDTYSYVAVEKRYALRAVKQLAGQPVKGRRFRARICR